jgi:hypothetical protein
MGPSPNAEQHPDDKPEILEPSNQKVPSVLFIVTAVLLIAVLFAALYRCG